MNNDDLYVSQGPVSSMPGSRHSMPEGSMCDEHPTVPAVARVQGETDSFGCEYYFACQQCLDADRAYAEAERQKEKYCEWHRGMGLDVRPTRDYEEGSSLPPPPTPAMGGDTEQLCELLGMWHDAGGLTPEEKAVVQKAYDAMQPPSDGLLGTAVSYPLTLPGLNGMCIHLQSVE